MNEAIQSANDTVQRVQSLTGILNEVQNVVDHDLNAPEIVAHLQALYVWVNGISNPKDIKSNILDAKTTVDSALSVELDEFSRALNGLVEKIKDQTYSGALESVILTKDFLDTTFEQVNVSLCAANWLRLLSVVCWIILQFHTVT